MQRRVSAYIIIRYKVMAIFEANFRALAATDEAQAHICGCDEHAPCAGSIDYENQLSKSCLFHFMT